MLVVILAIQLGIAVGNALVFRVYPDLHPDLSSILDDGQVDEAVPIRGVLPSATTSSSCPCFFSVSPGRIPSLESEQGCIRGAEEDPCLGQTPKMGESKVYFCKYLVESFTVYRYVDEITTQYT